MIFGLAVAALRGATGGGQLTLRILIIAFVASVIASIGYASLLLRELYDYTSWPNALWSLSYCTVIAGACYHSWYAAEPGAVTASVSNTSHDMLAWLPYLTIAFGFGVFFVSAVADWEIGHSPLIIIATVLTGVLVVRQERALRAERLARQESMQAQRMLEQINHELERRVNQRTAELALALEDVKRHAADQAALLNAIEQQRDIIREMSVPVLPVGNDTLVMPLVGVLDSARLVQVQEHALKRIEASRARRLLLDITGVPSVDAQVAQGLVRVVQAARLLGASTTLVGVRPEVAQSIVNLGLDLSHIHTESDLQSALALQRHVSL
ncbi:MAG: STAS domain-containing protein [Oscillochloridaceae bacterium]|nr:STAS domain-containing protein [Chloroflexaceae bacterium]MDW8392322.1 STAS domain-containing protein [Oscillochloridaceae bacterium]